MLNLRESVIKAIKEADFREGSMQARPDINKALKQEHRKTLKALSWLFNKQIL